MGGEGWVGEVRWIIGAWVGVEETGVGLEGAIDGKKERGLVVWRCLHSSSLTVSRKERLKTNSLDILAFNARSTLSRRDVR